ncbi:MAG: IS200/IS605 family transposase [Deltaproteobacteria bacterium]|nr:IS200/IS605 family transposase [Deltaproteobacteria bacterium]
MTWETRTQVFFVHIVFRTKANTPWIDSNIRPRLYRYIGGIIKNERQKLLAAGGTHDHIHLLVSLRTDKALANFVRVVKANSSKWLHETYTSLKNEGWQSGYGAFTVSYSNVEAVKKYIETQEEHHQKISFVDELKLFLKKHQIPFDDRFLR